MKAHRLHKRATVVGGEASKEKPLELLGLRPPAHSPPSSKASTWTPVLESPRRSREIRAHDHDSGKAGETGPHTCGKQLWAPLATIGGPLSMTQAEGGSGAPTGARSSAWHHSRLWELGTKANFQSIWKSPDTNPYPSFTCFPLWKHSRKPRARPGNRERKAADDTRGHRATALGLVTDDMTFTCILRHIGTSCITGSFPRATQHLRVYVCNACLNNVLFNFACF